MSLYMLFLNHRQLHWQLHLCQRGRSAQGEHQCLHFEASVNATTGEVMCFFSVGNPTLRGSNPAGIQFVVHSFT